MGLCVFACARACVSSYMWIGEMENMYMLFGSGGRRV